MEGNVKHWVLLNGICAVMDDSIIREAGHRVSAIRKNRRIKQRSKADVKS